MTSGEFFSRGKLLLTGEYCVLYGARALAVPSRFGQWMQVKETTETGLLYWETFVQGKSWFTATFNLTDMSVASTSDEKTARFLLLLLKESNRLQPGLQLKQNGFQVTAQLDFDIRWGLGSSSSLISNLAYWFDIDPFELFRRVLPGSGYDVFCARATQPVIYRLINEQPVVDSVNFFPEFHRNLYLVYLGNKQDSQESVRRLRADQFRDETMIDEISRLTDSMINAGSLDDFFHVMRLHEDVISAVLGLPVIKKDRFADFDGEIKSLGAWGGDFVLAATRIPEEKVKAYFLRRNLPVIFRYDEIVI